jgi:glutaredoxin 3
MLKCKNLRSPAAALQTRKMPLQTLLVMCAQTRILEDFRRRLQWLRAADNETAASDGTEVHLLSASPWAADIAEETGRPRVEIYTTSWCPYCRRAKALLDRKGIAYIEIDIEEKPARRREMADRAGGRTSVPQIFIGGRGIGGSDDLRVMERSGELDRLLGRGAAQKQVH